MKQFTLEGYPKKTQNKTKKAEMYPAPLQQLRWSSLWHKLIAFSRQLISQRTRT